MQWAMKCSAMQVDGQWREVYKQPVGDASKASKKGRLTLAGSQAGGWRTERIDGADGAPADDALQTVFENGEIVRTQSFDDVRARAAAGVQRLADAFAL
jgi:nicotinamide phosphoribosyltransferase